MGRRIREGIWEHWWQEVHAGDGISARKCMELRYQIILNDSVLIKKMFKII